MFLLKDLFTQIFKQACSFTMRNMHNSDCKQAMKCELCEMLKRKGCYGNKLESFHGNSVRLYALFLRTIYAHLRLWSFESGCMHNLLKSIPTTRCLKSRTCYHVRLRTRGPLSASNMRDFPTGGFSGITLGHHPDKL